MESLRCRSAHLKVESLLQQAPASRASCCQLAKKFCVQQDAYRILDRLEVRKTKLLNVKKRSISPSMYAEVQESDRSCTIDAQHKLVCRKIQGLCRASFDGFYEVRLFLCNCSAIILDRLCPLHPFQQGRGAYTSNKSRARLNRHNRPVVNVRYERGS